MNKSRYTDHRAQRLMTHAWFALGAGGFLALFLTTAVLGSGGKLSSIHWYLIAGIILLALAAVACLYAAAAVEARATTPVYAAVRATPIQPQRVEAAVLSREGQPGPIGAVMAQRTRERVETTRPLPVIQMRPAEETPVVELAERK